MKIESIHKVNRLRTSNVTHGNTSAELMRPVVRVYSWTKMPQEPVVDVSVRHDMDRHDNASTC